VHQEFGSLEDDPISLEAWVTIRYFAHRLIEMAAAGGSNLR
jgi:hypothetical protein